MAHSSPRFPLVSILALPLAATLVNACSDDFDTCEAQRTCSASGSGSGGSSSGGGNAAGGTGAGSGSGGRSSGGNSNIAGSDGSSGADSSSGGAGGNAGSDGGLAGAGASSGGGADGTPNGGAGNAGGSGAVGGTNAGTDAGAGAGGFGGEGGGIVEPRCGDAIVDVGEACDDGNQDRADGCRPNCSWGPKQVVAGAHSSCALFGNGAAKCWGMNQYTLAQSDDNHRGDQPGELGSALSLIHVGNTVAAFSALSINAMMTCGVVKQQLWCWGQNYRGMLGQGRATENPSITPVLLDLGGSVANVSVGFSHACALLTDGSVKCWGENVLGRLGIGYEGDVGDEPNEMGRSLRSVAFGEPATQVVAAQNHSCALLKSGKVVCWGRGGSWLGQGTTGDGQSFGDTPDESTPPAVPFGGSAAATWIGVGTNHSCAVLGGPLKCWGMNYSGKLGLGIDPAEAMGDVPEELGTRLPVVPITPTLGSDPVTAVYLGHNHTCALLGSGGVKCWGQPGEGRLAQPTLAPLLGNVGDAPDELSSLPVIDFGAGTTVRSLAVGNSHSCALLSTGDVKCWGFNSYGQLGLGHTNSVGNLASELGANMKVVPLE